MSSKAQNKGQPRKPGKKVQQKPVQSTKKQKQQSIVALMPYSPAPRVASARSGVLNPYLATIAHQIIDPGNAVEIVNTPCPNSAYVVAKRFTRVVDYALPAGQSQFSIFMSPNLSMPGFITNTGSTVFPAVSSTLSYTGTLSCVGSTSPVGASDVKAYGQFTSTTSETVLVHTVQVIDAALVAYPGYLLAGPGGIAAEFACTYQNDSEQEIRIQAVLRTPAGNWAGMGAVVVPAGSIAYHNLNMAAFSGFAWRCLTPNVAAQTIKVFAGFRQAQLTTTNGIDFAPAFAKQILDNDISLGRVLSLRFTATNTSNALSLGGNASCARVPPLFNPFDHVGDLPTSMSRLPPNRVYQGAASTGCSCFWMPEQLDEWTVDNVQSKIRSYSESSFLLGHLSGLPDGASFRIKFSWLVEFYTPTQLFSPSETPGWSPQWEEVMHLLVALDAATCNPDSSGMFDRFLNNGRKYLSRAKQHYSMHQDTYGKLYQLLQTLGPLMLG